MRKRKMQKIFQTNGAFLLTELSAAGSRVANDRPKPVTCHSED
jgi:hypothetical protein